MYTRFTSHSNYNDLYKVDDTNYFVGKLIIYLVIVAALATVSWKLIRSARNNGREDERNGVEHE